jgi:D-glycero-alpha-D-manno-heptose-7-phosphate kinase
MLIISSCPVRISFGSADHSPFAERFGGVALNACIKQRVYTFIRSRNELEEHKYRISYSKTELCNDVDDIQLDLVRASIKRASVHKPVEIIYSADVPVQTGLGTSSAMVLALLRGLLLFNDTAISDDILAEWAYTLEREEVKEQGGFQDSYIGYGGINYLTGQPHKVERRAIPLTPQQTELLEDHLMLIYLGNPANSGRVLQDQLAKLRVDKTLEETLAIKHIVEEIYAIFNSTDFHPSCLIGPMRESWELKKKLSDNMTNDTIENLEKKITSINKNIALRLVGGGGGRGTLMVIADPNYRDEIKNIVAPFKCVDVKIDWDGVKTRRIF